MKGEGRGERGEGSGERGEGRGEWGEGWHNETHKETEQSLPRDLRPVPSPLTLLS